MIDSRYHFERVLGTFGKVSMNNDIGKVCCEMLPNVPPQNVIKILLNIFHFGHNCISYSLPS